MRDPRRVVQILGGRITILQRHRIDDVHRRPRRAEMHLRSAQVQVVLRLPPMQRDVARRHRQHVLNQRAGKADAPVIALHRPGPGQQRHPRRRGLRQPDHLQRLQRAGVNLRDPRLGQRPVLPSRHPRPHRAQRLRERSRPLGHPRRPSPRAPRPRGFAHLAEIAHAEHTSAHSAPGLRPFIFAQQPVSPVRRQRAGLRIAETASRPPPLRCRIIRLISPPGS